ncbi:MAG: AAA family ATPase [Mycobacterium leprae]
MKPLFLEFAGLHSYREAQQIDFTQLLGGGLFGIFGPTGSGKSTVLDAITLALYGTVDRADRNTRGILNQSEQQLWVKFKFALHGPEGERQYRVERSFKREDETAVRASHSRFVMISEDGEQVLADRPQDVTKQVEEVLGLRVEDFTRAVVLPQGKFADFLRQEPKGRREMLQRLFALSQYGDKLGHRLKNRLAAVEGDLRSVEGQQQGLGDASDAAVEAATQILTGAEGAVATADTELGLVEAEYQAWQKVWQLQAEVARVEQELDTWRKREPEVTLWREEYQAAQKAEPIRPVILERQDARRQLAAAEAKHATAQKEQTAAYELAETAQGLYDVAHARRQLEAPLLTEQQVRLKQALALEQEAAELGAKVQELSGRVAKGRQVTQQTQQELTVLGEQASALVGQQAGALAQLTAAEVDSDRRRQVQAALMALNRYHESVATCTQLEQRLAARESELDRVRVIALQAEAKWQEAAQAQREQQQALEALSSEPPVREDDVRFAVEWLARAEETALAVAALEDELEQVRRAKAEAEADHARLRAEVAAAAAAEGAARNGLEQARKRVTDARTELESQRLMDLAGSVAATLEHGTPCPVCGSLDHPHPAAAADLAASEAAKTALATAEAELVVAEREEEAASRKVLEADGHARVAESKLAAATDTSAQAESRLQGSRAKLPESWRAVAAHSLPAIIQREREENVRQQRQLQEWHSQVDSVRRTLDGLAKAASQAESMASSSRATLQASERAQVDAAADLAEAVQLRGNRLTELDSARGDLSPEALAEESHRIEIADQAAARLRQQLTELVQERQALEQAQREKQAQLQRYLDALGEREQQLNAATEQAHLKEQQLADLAGGRPAAPQLEAVSLDLARLDRAESEAKSGLEVASTRRNSAEMALAAAVREQELARSRAEKSEVQLQGALAAAGFADASVVEAALRPSERRQELEGAIQAYEREGDRLTGRQDSLCQDLGGRWLDAEGWAERQGQLAESRRQAQEAREARARAAQVLDDLKSKHVRWQQLEQERGRLATLQGNLTDLQSLLRGNAFVEFLAEGQLNQLAQVASERLGQLTRHRYALEIDSGGGFVIRDDANGGMRRPVSTLSGGETFLSSLALALTLSAQIQLRGRHPLEFFFLDEGFGTLDPDLLNLVIDTLERLHFERLHVGVISHVPELRSRLQRRLVVEPSEAGGRGSSLILEMA